MVLICFPQAGGRILLVIFLIWSAMPTKVKGKKIISEGPLSLLIPTGETGTFTCKANCSRCLSYWIINGSQYPTSDTHPALGFMVSIINSPLFTMIMLTVNTSESVNGSRIRCLYRSVGDTGDYDRSDEAILMVIATSPVAQNPTIDYERLTNHITLLWSPPFLWPGERIHHYNVIFAIKRQCTITNYWVNGDYGAETVSFTRRIKHDDIPVCTEFEFFISAISIDTSNQLQTFNVTGWIMPSNVTTIEPLRIININIYFAADGKPVMTEVYIQVSTCHSLPLHYTIRLGNAVIESGQIGYQHSHSNVTVVNEIIKTDLQVNRSYLLQVTTNIYSLNVQTSDQWIFNTSLPKHEPCNTTGEVQAGSLRDLISYQVTVVVFGLFVAILLFLALISVIFYCSRRIRKNKCVNSKNRVQKSMVDNPIYVGNNVPVYDSIMTQPERIQSAGSDQKDKCITNPHYESLHMPNSKEMADTDRYIDQPTCIQPRKELCCGSSLANSQSEIEHVRCNSTSVSATTMSGLKSNGQPRNKLGLILSLGVNDPCNPVLGDNAQSRMHTVQNSITSDKLEEEAYAIMNPARPFLQTGHTESMKKRRE